VRDPFRESRRRPRKKKKKKKRNIFKAGQEKKLDFKSICMCSLCIEKGNDYVFFFLSGNAPAYSLRREVTLSCKDPMGAE
jgi:hypothetical protein